MSNSIIDTANEYKKVAQMLEVTAKAAAIDRVDSEFIEGALLRLFYAKSLELKLDRSSELLDEESDMDAFDAVREANDAVDKVSEITFEQIESYSADDKKFEIQVSNASVNLDSEDSGDLLRQLYKCEGIIQMAQRTSQHHNIYGGAARGWERLEGIDNEPAMSPEETIFKDLGIDMYELLDVREKLVAKLEGMITQ